MLEVGNPLVTPPPSSQGSGNGKGIEDTGEEGMGVGMIRNENKAKLELDVMDKVTDTTANEKISTEGEGEDDCCGKDKDEIMKEEDKNKEEIHYVLLNGGVKMERNVNDIDDVSVVGRSCVEEIPGSVVQKKKVAFKLDQEPKEDNNEDKEKEMENKRAEDIKYLFDDDEDGGPSIVTLVSNGLYASSNPNEELKGNMISPSSSACSTSPSSGSSCPLTPINQSAKKSNLKKVSKYADSPAYPSPSFFGKFVRLSKRGMPNGDGDDQPSPVPRKRIRIISLGDEVDEDFFDDGKPSAIPREGEVGDTSSGFMFRTDNGNEELIWISPPSAPMDFKYVSDEIVRAARILLPPNKFSVEVDTHYIDGATINPLIDCRKLIANLGCFNYEKTSLIQRLPPGTNGFLYPEDALSFKYLDDATNNDLTFPKDLLNPEHEEGRVFYFADIWSASKGFREYILSKSQEHMKQGIFMKGFAIQHSDKTRYRNRDFVAPCGVLFNSFNGSPTTHKNDEDLSKQSLPVELVEYFKTERGNAFDICDIGVSDDFVQLILSRTDDDGVHLLVADTPETFSCLELVREVRYQREFYAQCIIALLAVREGGSFVARIYGAITPFTGALIFLMHRCFQNVTICKPPMSSSGGLGRFLVCTKKMNSDTSEDILQFLLKCHNMVTKKEQIRRVKRTKGTRKRLDVQYCHVRQLVPAIVITSHSDFFEFLRLQNIRLGQTVAGQIRERCSTMKENTVWKLKGSLKEEGTESAEDSIETRNPEQYFFSLLDEFGLESNLIPELSPQEITKTELKDISASMKEWVVFPFQNCRRLLMGIRNTLFIGMGGSHVFYLQDSKFKAIHIDGLILTKGTILYANVTEVNPACADLSQKTRMQLKFQILDGISLSGQYIGGLPYETRIQRCKAYASALNKVDNSEAVNNNVVVTVPEPIVLKQGELSLSCWIKSRVRQQDGLNGYPGSFKIFNHPKSDSEMAVVLGGFEFYKISKNAMDSFKHRVLWTHDHDVKGSSSPSSFTEEDLIDFGI